MFTISTFFSERALLTIEWFFKKAFVLLCIYFSFLAGLGLCSCTRAVAVASGGFPSLLPVCEVPLLSPFLWPRKQFGFFCQRDLSPHPPSTCVVSHLPTSAPLNGVYFSLWIIAQSHFISLVRVSASTFRSFFSCHGAHLGGDVSTSHFGGVAGASHSPPQSTISPGSLFLSWRLAFRNRDRLLMKGTSGTVGKGIGAGARGWNPPSWVWSPQRCEVPPTGA